MLLADESETSAGHGRRTRTTPVKRSTRLPIAVGFGVKTPQQVKAIAAGADGVVVGSALVNAVRESLGPKGESTGKTVPKVLDLVKSLSQALRPA